MKYSIIIVLSLALSTFCYADPDKILKPTLQSEQQRKETLAEFENRLRAASQKIQKEQEIIIQKHIEEHALFELQQIPRPLSSGRKALLMEMARFPEQLANDIGRISIKVGNKTIPFNSHRPLDRYYDLALALESSDVNPLEIATAAVYQNLLAAAIAKADRGIGFKFVHNKNLPLEPEQFSNIHVSKSYITVEISHKTALVNLEKDMEKIAAFKIVRTTTKFDRKSNDVSFSHIAQVVDTNNRTLFTWKRRNVDWIVDKLVP